MALFGAVKPATTLHFPQALGRIQPLSTSPDDPRIRNAIAIDMYRHYQSYDPSPQEHPTGNYDALLPTPIALRPPIRPLHGLELQRTFISFQRLSSKDPVKTFCGEAVAEYKSGFLPPADKIKNLRQVIAEVIGTISQGRTEFESSLCVLRVFAAVFQVHDDVLAQAMSETKMTVIRSLWPQDQRLPPDATTPEGRAQILDVILQASEIDKSALLLTAQIFGSLWNELSDDNFLTLLKGYEDVLEQASQNLEAVKDRYIEEFIDLLDKSPWIFPFTVDEIRRMISGQRFEFLDPVYYVYNRTEAQYDLMMGRIRLSLVNLMFDQFHESTTHELLHILGHPTVVVTRSDDIFLRRGIAIHLLKFFGILDATLQRGPYLTWLNEAVVEYLAMTLMGMDPNHTTAYPNEVRLLMKILDSGISLQLFIDAMCEPIFLEDTQRHHVALRTLIDEIEKKFGPDFLKETDRLWYEDHEAFQRLFTEDPISKDGFLDRLRSFFFTEER